MQRKRVSRISISIPPDLLQDFDKTIKDIGYDRSKGIQIAMRDFLTERKWIYDKKGLVAGALTIIYDHEVKKLNEDLTDIQHHYHNIINSSMHIHLDKSNCLEIIAVKGDTDDIRELSKKLMVRGVKQIKLSILS